MTPIMSNCVCASVGAPPMLMPGFTSDLLFRSTVGLLEKERRS